MEKLNLSDLTILKSPAGYYLGRTDMNQMPYSRQSEYYPNITTAKFALMVYPNTRRPCDENTKIYAMEDKGEI